MKIKVITTVLSALSISFSIGSSAADLQLVADQPTVVRSVGTGFESAKPGYQSNVYIVQLEDAAVASYMGGMEGLAATSNRATGASVLNVNSNASKAYAKYLEKKQADFIGYCEATFGHSLNVKFDYQHALNGLAVEISAEEAKTMQAMPGVKNVSRERFEVPLTDAGPQWINAPSIWTGPPNNFAQSRGEGTVIAVLDSGINHAHPSYAEIGGDGFVHTNPLGSGNFVPGSYCDVPPDDAPRPNDPSFCNDKLIGAWSFVDLDPNFPAPEDFDEDSGGHGSHTSSTAAGNVVPAATLLAPTTNLTRDVSGVAPHANLIMYDVCVVSCPGSALLAAINQVVIDAGNIPGGIQALNFSISGGGDPYTDPIELGFLNATAAGVYVAASAGNDGPGAATNAHNGPWVSTTAAMTHNRAIENSLVDLNSDGAPLADINGAGFTAGFGPAPIINSADLEETFPGSRLCGLTTADPDVNISPWPPGTFNGEIVACTRGTFGRVEKGVFVEAAGGGGYILMDNGGGIIADAHVLPGVHISQDDGAVLAAWLADNTNPTGSITEFVLNLDESNGDIMAGFSSRGPNTINVIKPDIGGPGVSIMAAGAVDSPSRFQFLSGTSMSSPHNAGSGALLSAVQPDWTPYQIKSALMMTAERNSTVKEDGSTPTDPFDLGAGRLDLSRAQEAGLVLDETPENFLAANPALGGDPKTLNLASMQNGNCVGTCSWTRTVENVAGHTTRWDLSTTGPAGLELSTDPGRKLRLKKGKSMTITVTADTSLAAPGWNFGTLELERNGTGPGHGPDLHMPIAVFAANSSNADLLSKTVDTATAAEGEPLNYEISISNGQLAGQIDLTDILPDGLEVVPGSLSEVITNGSTILPFSSGGGTLNWSGTLDPGGLQLTISPAPFGFIPLAALGVAPFGCPSNCDDGGVILNVPSFVYNGQSYSRVIWSVNGTIEAGTASGQTTSSANQNLPNPTAPNNLIAPFWTDLNMGVNGDGAEWSVAVLAAGPRNFTVYEWENIPLFGDLSNRYTFQIWVENGPSGNIWFVYGSLDDVNAQSITVGVENETGTVGSSRFFESAGTPPAVGTDLMVEQLIGGIATFTFQAEIDDCEEGEAIVNRVNVTTAGTADTAIAVTQCVEDDDDDKKK